jgi:hypothetical protein
VPKKQITAQSAHTSYHTNRGVVSRLLADTLRRPLRAGVSRFARRQKGRKLTRVYAESRQAVTPVRTTARLSPLLSRTVRKLALSLQPTDTAASRVRALLHARSVRDMLVNERSLSA